VYMDCPFESGHLKKHNPAREFYRCAKPIDEQCSYFAWVDELRLSQTTTLPPTPESAGPSRQTYLEPPSTPTPTQSMKRNISDVEDGSEGFQRSLSGSQKRTKIMQEVLSDPSSSQNLHSEETSHTGQSSVLQENKFKPAHEPASPSLTARHNNGESRNEVSVGSSTAWPPRTPSRQQNNMKPDSSFLTPSPGHVGFHGHGQASNISVLGASGSQKTESEENAQELTVDSVSNMIRQLGKLPDYVRKLERKKIAAEKSRDAKNTKMVNLQNEVQTLEREITRLKAREKELEEVIAAYEHDA